MQPPDIVSRETAESLDRLCHMIQRWNKVINLVSASTLPHLRTRHVADSLQLMRYAPSQPRHWVDLGSGGGFPGLVVAACLAEISPTSRVTLIESDQRKAAFLREAARHMCVTVKVIAERIESIENQHADVLSARALAPLAGLLDHAARHLETNGRAIFPKGQDLRTEIDHAKEIGWQFDATQHTSVTDPTGTILIVQKITRAI